MRALLLSSVFLASCVPNYNFGDAVVVCSGDGQCPHTYSCDLELQRCVGGTSNRPTAPTLVLGAIAPSGARFVDAVDVPYNVDDRNLGVGGTPGETVSLHFEFGVGAPPTQWFAATAQSDPAPVTDRRTSGVFRWLVKTDAMAGTAGLALHPDGYVTLAENIVVRATAVDTSGLSSPAITTDTFSIGDVPPTATVNPFVGTVFAGLVPIALQLTDTSADPASLQVEFRTSGDPQWRRALIDESLTAHVPTSIEGTGVLVAWQSAAPPQAALDQAQGIGGVWVNDVEIRARAADAPDGQTRFGPFSTGALIASVRNQTPPQITELEVLRTPGLDGTAPFALTYALLDTEGDTVDIRAEVSIDGGLSWNALAEYPDPASEGFFDLATPPAGTVGNTGIKHVLMVDPAGATTRTADARIRLLASDGFPAGAPTVVSAEIGIGKVGTPDVSFFTTLAISDNFAADLTIGEFVSTGNGVDVAELIQSSLYIYHGDGTGAFAASADVTRSIGVPMAIAQGDFNADGKMDLVVADQSASKRVVVLLAPITNVSTMTPYSLGITPNAVTVADVDHDTHPDLVVVGETKVVVLRGSAAGTFSAAETFSAGLNAQGLAVARFDSDDRLDVAVSGDNQIALLKGAASGPLLGAPALTSPGGTIARQLLAADFTGDAVPDLIVGMTGENEAVLMRNDGSGVFTAKQRMGLGASITHATAIAAADIDGDTLLDVLLTDYSHVLVIPGDTINRSFTAPRSYDVSGGTSGISVGDINGDGAPDIVVASDGVADNFVLSILVSGGQASARWGDGTFIAQETWETGVTPMNVEVADTDRDGRADLVLSSRDTARIYTLLGEGVGATARASFSTNAQITTPLGHLQEVAVVDLNRDGIMDYASVHAVSTLSSADALVVTFGSLTDVPAQGTPIVTGQVPKRIVAADLNNDGIADLVIINNAPSTLGLTIVMGSGPPGAWSGAVTHLATIAVNPAAVAVGDFDGDNKPDIAVALNANIAIHHGHGDGTFDVFTTTNVSGANIYEMVSGDFNADNRDDLAVGGFKGLQILLATGGTSFSIGAILPCNASTAGFNAIAKGDLNGDGAWDLVTGGASGCRFQGSGTGPFSPLPNDPFTINAAEGLAIADLNQDGVNDLVFANNVANQAAVFVGRDQTRARRKVRLGDDISVHGVDTLAPSPRWTADVHHSLSRRKMPGDDVRKIGLHTLRPSVLQTKVQAITFAERFAGDVKFKRVPAANVAIGAVSGERLRIVARLGPYMGSERIGLKLDTATDRGVVLKLPIASPTSVVTTDLTNAANTLVVVLGTTTWTTADRINGDPLAAVPGANAYLPRIFDKTSNAYRDVLIPQTTWSEIPRDSDGDLTTGTGPRFTLDVSDPADRAIYVLTDTLGVIQAYVITP